MIAAYGLAAFMVAIGVVAIRLGRDDAYLSRVVSQRHSMRIAESSVKAQRVGHFTVGALAILLSTVIVLGQIIG